MRVMKNKKGLSEIIAYVLLISIAVAISILVYGWLKGQVTVNEGISCPDGVSLIIENYSCSYATKVLSLNLQNKGFFDIEGYNVKVNNRTGADFGIYSINESGVKILVGKEFYSIYSLNSVSKPVLVDVQPIVLVKGKRAFCKSIVQEINC